MKENDTATQWEARFEDEDRQIANMDEYDFLNLLMESRIIEPAQV